MQQNDTIEDSQLQQIQIPKIEMCQGTHIAVDCNGRALVGSTELKRLFRVDFSKNEYSEIDLQCGPISSISYSQKLEGFLYTDEQSRCLNFVDESNVLQVLTKCDLRRRYRVPRVEDEGDFLMVNNHMGVSLYKINEVKKLQLICELNLAVNSIDFKNCVISIASIKMIGFAYLSFQGHIVIISKEGDLLVKKSFYRYCSSAMCSIPQSSTSALLAITFNEPTEKTTEIAIYRISCENSRWNLQLQSKIILDRRSHSFSKCTYYKSLTTNNKYLFLLNSSQVQGNGILILQVNENGKIDKKRYTLGQDSIDDFFISGNYLYTTSQYSGIVSRCLLNL